MTSGEGLYTKRPSLVVLATALAISLISGPGRADDLSVGVFVGPLGETLKKAIVTPFAEKSGLDVSVDDRDWGIGAVRSRIESGSGVWDVVSVEDYEVVLGCDEGFLEKIDTSRLPNLKNFDFVDERLKCAVPMVFYNTALGYNKDAVKSEPQTWADLWDTQKWPGKRSLYKSPQDTLEIALMADGVPAKDVYKVLGTPEGVDRAFKKLDQLKPNIVWWSNVGQSRQMLASGETVMTVTYDNGIYYFNKTQKTNFGVARKDAITHVNYWAVVAGTERADNAYNFLQFASEAQPQADVSNLLAISVPNRDALSLVTEDLRPNLSANPENLKQSISSDTDFWLNNMDALTKRFDAWVAGE